MVLPSDAVGALADRRKRCAALQEEMDALRRDCDEEGLRVQLLREKVRGTEAADVVLVQHAKQLEQQRDAGLAALASLTSEIQSVERQLAQLSYQEAAATALFDATRTNLSDRYVAAKKALAGGSAATVEAQAAALDAVVAEQQHEISVLTAVLAEAQRMAERAPSAGPTPAGGSVFVSARPLVALPSAEAVVPVPTGALRRLTLQDGSGLHQLRQRFLVGCRTEEGPRDGVQLRVWGHANGVRAFVDHIQALLGPPSVQYPEMFP